VVANPVVGQDPLPNRAPERKREFLTLEICESDSRDDWIVERTQSSLAAIALLPGFKPDSNDLEF
jgi:hypothetical protein